MKIIFNYIFADLFVWKFWTPWPRVLDPPLVMGFLCKIIKVLFEKIWTFFSFFLRFFWDEIRPKTNITISIDRKHNCNFQTLETKFAHLGKVEIQNTILLPSKQKQKVTWSNVGVYKARSGPLARPGPCLFNPHI